MVDEMRTHEEANLPLVSELLFEDVERALEELEAGDDQYRRRTLVRTIFAAIEGWTHVLRRGVLEHATAHPEVYSADELAFLREQEKKRISPVGRFRSVLTMWVRANGINNLDLDTEEVREYWRIFERVTKVRNRIVHPKHINDLTITDKEIEEISTTYIAVTSGPGFFMLMKMLRDWLEKHKVLERLREHRPTLLAQTLLQQGTKNNNNEE